MGCCPLKFLHALEIDQSLLEHTSTATGVPHKILILKNNIIWPKVQRVRAYNFGAIVGVSSRNFSGDVPRRRNNNMGITLEGQPPEISNGKKKFGAISVNFPLWSWIHSARIDTSIIEKDSIHYNPFRDGRKNGELWSTNKKVIGTYSCHVMSCLATYLNILFRDTTFGPLQGAAPSNFYTR